MWKVHPLRPNKSQTLMQRKRKTNIFQQHMRYPTCPKRTAPPTDVQRRCWLQLLGDSLRRILSMRCGLVCARGEHVRRAWRFWKVHGVVWRGLVSSHVVVNARPAVACAYLPSVLQDVHAFILCYVTNVFSKKIRRQTGACT